MNFYSVVDQAIALLRQRGRVTYRALKRQFALDDEALADLTEELLYGQRLATDEDGRESLSGQATCPWSPSPMPPRPPLATRLPPMKPHLPTRQHHRSRRWQTPNGASSR